MDKMEIKEIAEKIRNYAEEHSDEVSEIIGSMIDTQNDCVLYVDYDKNTKEVRMYTMEGNTYSMPNEDKVTTGIFSTKALDIREMKDDKYSYEAIMDELNIKYEYGLSKLEENLCNQLL